MMHGMPVPSMKAAIETLEKLNAYKKKIIVIGDMLELGKEAETLS